MILISPRPETEDTIHILTFTNINVLLVKLPCKDKEPSIYLNYKYSHFSTCAFQFPSIGNPICFSFRNSEHITPSSTSIYGWSSEKKNITKENVKLLNLRSMQWNQCKSGNKNIYVEQKVNCSENRCKAKQTNKQTKHPTFSLEIYRNCFIFLRRGNWNIIFIELNRKISLTLSL